LIQKCGQSETLNGLGLTYRKYKKIHLCKCEECMHSYRNPFICVHCTDFSYTYLSFSRACWYTR